MVHIREWLFLNTMLFYPPSHLATYIQRWIIWMYPFGQCHFSHNSCLAARQNLRQISMVLRGWIQYDLWSTNKLPGSKTVNLATFMLWAVVSPYPLHLAVPSGLCLWRGSWYPTWCRCSETRSHQSLARHHDPCQDCDLTEITTTSKCNIFRGFFMHAPLYLEAFVFFIFKFVDSSFP